MNEHKSDSQTKNYPDAYIAALEKLRDVLTPHGIHIPAIREMNTKYDRSNPSNLIGAHEGTVVFICAEIYVPLDPAV